MGGRGTGWGRYLERRWLPWHALWIVLVAMCLAMSWWQFSVATAPHVPGAPVEPWRNYAYAANWLVFAGVAAWFWWRFMRDQFEAEAEAEAEAGAEAEAQPGRAVRVQDSPQPQPHPQPQPQPRRPPSAGPSATPRLPRPGEFDVFAGEDDPASGASPRNG